MENFKSFFEEKMINESFSNGLLTNNSFKKNLEQNIHVYLNSKEEFDFILEEFEHKEYDKDIIFINVFFFDNFVEFLFYVPLEIKQEYYITSLNRNEDYTKRVIFDLNKNSSKHIINEILKKRNELYKDLDKKIKKFVSNNKTESKLIFERFKKRGYISNKTEGYLNGHYYFYGFKINELLKNISEFENIFLSEFYDEFRKNFAKQNSSSLISFYFDQNEGFTNIEKTNIKNIKKHVDNYIEESLYKFINYDYSKKEFCLYLWNVLH